MNNNYFYHSHLRNIIAIFGSLFSNMTVVRKDRNGNVKQVIDSVPIEYSPRDKFLTRLEKQEIDDGDLSTRYHEVYPKMAFELLGISYSPDRAKNSNSKRTKKLSSDRGLVIDAPVPYDINLDLYIAAKNASEAHQIVEQILPYFKPQMAIRVRNMPFSDEIYDMAIKLDSVSWEDNYEGDFSDTRKVIFVLSFTIPYHFYGPVGSELERDVLRIKNQNDGDGNNDNLTDDEIDQLLSANKPLIKTVDIRDLKTNIDFYNPDNTEIMFRITE